MKLTMRNFRRKSRAALADEQLQQAIAKASGRFVEGREEALENLAHSEEMRDQLKRIREATMANLADHLETFERNAAAVGAQVHWARSGDEACQIVINLAEEQGVSKAVKSKSMVSEEIHLNDALMEAGITPIETDLGEWIVQLAEEPPSHIVAPAVHKTREDVARLFADKLGSKLDADIPALTAEARKTLRSEFLSAEMGITGANLLVAESGSLVLVTNEGNGRLVSSLPRLHIAVVGIEKVVPTWKEAELWLSLLARSATGQPLTIYTNIITGPAREDDLDGPEEVHIVLLDNRRTEILASEFSEMLSCIRCGACLNVCPVYTQVGGHAYHSPYSGPMGAVLTPLLFGLKEYAALPQASSLCGACLDVCPARIDLPELLLRLRRRQASEAILPLWDRLMEKAAGWLMSRPGLYRLAARIAHIFGGTRLAQLFFSAPLPQLSRRSFHDLWQSGELEE
jgi:L-lactate dehydrogenase complex protein LldF